jgi:hypothetical protein
MIGLKKACRLKICRNPKYISNPDASGTEGVLLLTCKHPLPYFKHFTLLFSDSTKHK